jgi:ATP-binding cassette, subfamily B, bacterial MsbA
LSKLLQLWPYLEKYRGRLVVIVITGAIMSACTASLAYLMRDLFTAFEKKDQNQIYLLPALVFAVYLLHAIARYFHSFLLKFTMDRVVAKIRMELQEKFLKLNLSYHFNFKTGGAGLLSQTLNDVTIIGNGMMILADLVREPVTVIFLLGTMFYIDWKLTLATLVFIPVIIGIMRIVTKGLRKHSYNQLDRLGELSSTLKETLDGIRIIQSFNLESEMRKKMSVVTDSYLKTRKSILRREEASGPLFETVGSFAFASIAIYIGHNILNSDMRIGDFVGFLTAMFSLQPSIKKLQEGYVRLQQCVAATERTIATINDPNEVKESTQSKAFPKDWQQITFKNVSFKYKDTVILKSLNFTVKRGEQIALVGESGSGKSTIVNLLMRFFEPNEGQILIGDTPIDQIALKDLRRSIAFVSQDVFLFNDTIANNIKAGDLTKNQDFVSSSISANAHTFIEKLSTKYDTKIGERGNLLSGGEKQRISIARAFFKDSPLLILDEATSALDSVNEVEVQKGLDSLMSGRTAIVIAHRLSTITGADRILVLKNGEVVEEGTHKDLLNKNGEYHRFYELQARM